MGRRRNDANLLQGDARAFAAFYRRHEDAVLGYFVRRTGQADVAADLTAEVFARALASRDRFDSDRGEAGAWLFGIARNLLAASVERGRVEDSMRRRLRMELVVIDDEAIDRINALEGEPASRALATLPGDQLDAIVGRVIEERDYGELAERLQCSESVVRQRVSRGLRALRTRVEGDA